MRTAPKAGAVAEEKSDEDKRFRQPLTSASSDSASSPKQALLAQLDRARERIEVNRQIVDWCIDLQARLWRAKTRFLYCDCSAAQDDLAAEVGHFRRICRITRKGAL